MDRNETVTHSSVLNTSTTDYLFNSTTESGNGTEPHKKFESWVPPAMLFLFGVVGNAIALIVLLATKKKHKWRPIYRYVGSLAITDGLGVLLVYPIAMIPYATDFTFVFPKPLCAYSSFVFVFMLIAAAGIVCAMSIDRFFAILFPFVYNRSGKRKRANILVAVIWIASGIISILHFIGLGSVLTVYPGTWCFSNFASTSTADRINSYIYSIIGLTLLCVTVTLNSVVIFIILKHILFNNGSRRIVRNTRREVFNLVFLLAIVITITSCFAPLTVRIFQHAALIVSGNGKTELYLLRQAVLNSAIDPWIYILLRKENIQWLVEKCHCLKILRPPLFRQMDGAQATTERI